jgi:hypothetical protein
MIKVRRLKQLGQFLRMQEQNPCRKSTLHKPEGTRRVGRPAVRWRDSVEADLKTMVKVKGKAIPVTGRGSSQGCETSRLPHFLDIRLTDGRGRGDH